ncbi:MAG: hypothetical protein HRU46_02035 [Verrucomicrobiales bacterium]|nr:hypothetical protein [Verrucomicrobiales bacterium]
MTVSVSAPAQDSQRPIKIIFVAGGPGHSDVDVNLSIRDGISERLSRPVEWKVKTASSGNNSGMKEVFPNAGWADGFDVAIHCHDFAEVTDGPYLERVLYPHTRGKPAVLLGRSAVSFGAVGSEWAKLAGSSGDSELNVWANEFGSGTRVYCNAVAFEAAAEDWAAYLDVVTRGVIWALGEKGDGLFRDRQGGDAPEITEEVLPQVTRVELGTNLLKGAELSAFSLPSLPQDGMGKVIDGDLKTSWELAGSGPGSLLLEMAESQSPKVIAVFWKDQADSYRLEVNAGGWSHLEDPFEDEDGKVRFYPVQSDAISGLRFSFSGKSEWPGLVEVVGYSDPKEIPDGVISTEIREELKEKAPVSVESNEAEVPKTWKLARVDGSEGWEIQQMIPRAEGGVWLFVRDSHGDGTGSVYLVNRDAGVTEFLHSTSPNAGITWDGEWLYVSGIEVRGRDESVYSVLVTTAYRDTNRDEVADERFELAEVDLRTAGVDGATGSQCTIADMAMGPGGEFYAILSSETEEDRLIQFHRKREAALSLFRSNDKMSWLSVTREGDVLVRVQSSEGSNSRVYRSYLIPDVSLENIAPISIADEALMGRPGVGGEVDLSGSGEEQRIWIRGPGLSEKGVEVASRARFSSVVIDGESKCWLLGEEAESTALYLASRRGGDEAPLSWDAMNDREVVEAFSHANPIVSFEAPIELSRRKRAFRKSILSRYTEAQGDKGVEVAWVRLSAFEGDRKDASSVAVAATKSEFPEVRALAFHFLGDEAFQRLRETIGLIQSETSVRVSAAILGAAARQNLKVDGLDELVAKFARKSKPELVVAARSFLINRGQVVDVNWGALREKNDEIDPFTGEPDLGVENPDDIVALIGQALETRSFKVRNTIISMLANKYQRQNLELQGKINSYLNGALSNIRVDPGYLLQLMHRNGIPIENPETLVTVARRDLPVESKAIELLQDMKLPVSAYSWLEDLIKDNARDQELRLRALSLLAASGDESALRRIPGIVDEWRLESVSREARVQFWKSWVENPAQSGQSGWLIGESKSSNAMRRKLAWRAMIHQYSQNGGPGDIEDRFRAMATAPGERLEELKALVLEMEAQGVAKLLNTGPDLSG